MAHDVPSLVALCLSDATIPGPCGPRDPWDDAVWLDGDPEAAWQFITEFAARATTVRQFERLAAGPLDDFCSEHRDAYLSRLAAVAHELPALVNLVIAVERRNARAFDVMTLVSALANRSSEAPDGFHFTPPDDLARLVTPGAHPMTAELLLPNVSQFSRRRTSAEPSEEKIAEIVERYVQGPLQKDDDWWWPLDDLVTTAPRAAWRAILAIIAREGEGVSLASLGAGALETLVSDHGELLADEIQRELETNPAFVRTFSSCYLFSLFERLLIELAATCRRLVQRER